MKKDYVKISLNISKELENRILRNVDEGSFTDTKTSIIVKILEKHYKIKGKN